MVGDAPDAAALVVGNIKRSVGPHGEAGRPVSGAAGLSHRAGKAVGKDDEGSEALPSANGWKTTL